MKGNLIKILFILLFLSFQLEAKIRLLTFHYNRPDFIEYQKRCLDRFLVEKEDYELIVFNDGPTEEMASKIEAACNKWNVQCVRYNQSWHRSAPLIAKIKEWAKMPNLPDNFPEFLELLDKHPSVRHCNVIQYALDNYGYNHDDIVGLVDGDMFLIRPTSIRQLLENYSIVGTQKTEAGTDYFWVALTLFDMRKLPDRESLRFNVSWVGNCILDSGGHSYYYIQSHPDVPKLMVKKVPLANVKQYKKVQLEKILKYSPAEVDLIKNMNHDAEFHFGGHFLHYLRSSFLNSENRYANETTDYHHQKSLPISSFFNRILNN